MIEIFVDARNFGKEYGSAYAVILRKDKIKWEVSFDCGDISSNIAALHAIRYAMLSVKPDFRSHETKIFINNQYIDMMLAKDSRGYWDKNPKQNIDLVKAIRALLNDQFTNTTIDKSKDPMMIRVKDLSAMAAKDKKYVDSRAS